MLHKLGVKTVMLTGDNQAAAEGVARQTGVKEVHAALLPRDKMELVEQEKRGAGSKARVVAMVGDGVNDAPALAQADLGLAMGASGTVVAMETADVSLMDNDLRKLPNAIKLGRAVERKILQNVIFSIVVKVFMIALALFGYAWLWLAILSDVGAMLCVTLNSMSILGEIGRAHV